MTDQLQLRDWQQMCQAKAAHYAGTPEAESYLAESKRYGMAADRIEELTRIIAGLRADKRALLPASRMRTSTTFEAKARPMLNAEARTIKHCLGTPRKPCRTAISSLRKRRLWSRKGARFRPSTKIFVEASTKNTKKRPANPVNTSM